MKDSVDIVLLCDDVGEYKKDSEEAERVLREAKIKFTGIPTSGEGVAPILFAGNRRYAGLEGVMTFFSTEKEKKKKSFVR